jgi:AraC-like DNA-binding protein
MAENNAAERRLDLHYREYSPDPALGLHVRNYWSVRGWGTLGNGQNNRVMPDGCLDVIFDLRASSARPAIVVGAMLTAGVFQYVGPVDLFGARFVPGAAPLFLRAPAAELTDTTIDACTIWSDVDDLVGLMLESEDLRARIRLLDQYLIRRLRPDRPYLVALRGMALIERARGQLRVERICETLNVTERALQRVFASYVGITPKQALRVMRFRHTLNCLQREPRGSLSSIALSCGYADQAHFNREFRELAGLTPTEYLKEHTLVGFLQDVVPGDL